MWAYQTPATPTLSPFSPELFTHFPLPSYLSFPSEPYLQLQKDYQDLASEKDQLAKEVQALRSETEATRLQMTQKVKQLEQKLSAESRREMKREVKRRKRFRKNQWCPVEECDHRYSSKIALNHHIRHKHGLNPSEVGQ